MENKKFCSLLNKASFYKKLGAIKFFCFIALLGTAMYSKSWMVVALSLLLGGVAYFMKHMEAEALRQCLDGIADEAPRIY